MVLVDYLVLADAAAVAEGKHYIHGAGWDTLYASSYPVTHPQMSVAFRLRCPWNDTNIQHQLELDVVDADEQSILPRPPGTMRGDLRVGRPATAIVGADQTIPMVFNIMGLQFFQQGTYVVVLRVDGVDAARSPLQLVTGPDRQPRAGGH